ncbi:MAG TPA: glycerate kinase [Bryobacteraceae bacterium]|nr:glycerate kinase [Bryobacteraceae bacterium]
MTLRKHALTIFRAAIRAADPVEAVARHFVVSGGSLRAGGWRYALSRFDRIFVIGAGKASASMARAVEHVLGKRISAGLINVKYGHTDKLKRIELNECGHPTPDEAGVRGAARIAAIAEHAGERDLVIALMSGGGSALLPAPAAPVTLAEKQAVTALLLDCGANIHEINAVRKHISSIKGGQLARLAYPAAVIALLLSDVIGDDLDVIGSGPTAPDASTYAAAIAILRKYGIDSRAPAAVRERLERGASGEIPETPKAGDPTLGRTQNIVVGSNILAVNAAAAKARELGHRPLVLSTFIEGETRDVARMHAAIARQARLYGQPARAPACIVSGGETTVTIRGNGKGGRNQEFALAAAIDLAGLEDVLILSGGTDGTDGPTDAAGAVADGETCARARKLGMQPRQYLANNDAYHFFQPLGDLLITGPTRTNVMDVRLILIGPSK